MAFLCNNYKNVSGYFREVFIIKNIHITDFFFYFRSYSIGADILYQKYAVNRPFSRIPGVSFMSVCVGLLILVSSPT